MGMSNEEQHSLLSAELAQRVVDQVFPTLDHHINVMDRVGIIIASSDHSRLGTLHGGARRVIATRSPVSIREDDEAEHARIGVNLPLVIDSEIAGVVGITGDPSAVTPVGQVLVLTIGLLLARERELDATARREARDRDLLSRLVNARSLSDPLLSSLQSQLPRLPGPWQLSAVVGAESAGAEVATLPHELPSLVRKIESFNRFRFASFQGAFWVLGAGRDADNLELEQALADDMLVVHGERSHTVEGLLASAKTLAALVERPRFLPQNKKRLHTQGLAVELAVTCMPSEIVAQFSSRIRNLTDAQRETIVAFVESGHSIAGAARELYAHRNTVMQRLDRITEICGLDPRVPHQSVALQFALVAMHWNGRNVH